MVDEPGHDIRCAWCDSPTHRTEDCIRATEQALHEAWISRAGGEILFEVDLYLDGWEVLAGDDGFQVRQVGYLPPEQIALMLQTAFPTRVEFNIYEDEQIAVDEGRAPSFVRVTYLNAREVPKEKAS